MLSFFPLDVLDETWDVIESVSEGFLTYLGLQLAQWLLRRCLKLSHYESPGSKVKQWP